MDRTKWDTLKQIRKMVLTCLHCSPAAKQVSGTAVSFKQKKSCVKIILILGNGLSYFTAQRIKFYSVFLWENVHKGIKYILNFC